MPKRILILTAGFGEGHNAAARGLRDGLAALAPEEAEVEVRDLFAETYGLANEWTRRSYLTLINRAPGLWDEIYRRIDAGKRFGPKLSFLFSLKRRLQELLLSWAPDVVVSVFPAYPHLLDEIVGSTAPSFRRIVCITDSITVNAIWYRCATDLFFVPNDLTAAVLAAAGVPNDKVQVTGFPVSPLFAQLGELRQQPSLEYGRRVLYMINPGRVVLPEIIHQVAAIPGVRLTVTVGRNQRLRRAIESILKSATRKFEIVGWSDQLPRLMLESHLLVTKAGGATVQEAIAARCPMIINQIVPGQEQGNARLVVGTRSGIVATTPEAIASAVEGAFANDARQWREWAINIGLLSRPGASLEIAHQLLTSTIP